MLRLFGNRENRDAKHDAKMLRMQVDTLQAMVTSYKTGMQDVNSYAGNPYPQYEQQVAALNLAYLGKAKWGSHTVKTLVDIRSAFAIANGIEPVSAFGDDEDVRKELDYIKAFMKWNNLDMEGVQDWARESELEGKALIRLSKNGKGMIDARFISFAANSYHIESDPEDYAKYVKATYNTNKSGMPVALEPSEFVYKRFGGRVSLVNETPPKLGSLLWSIENLDRAMYDWRKANTYFAFPTPYFKTETESQAKNLLDALRQMQWKVGQFIVGTGEFNMVGMPAENIDSLEREIVNHTKVISGGSGVPVHFLGYPELMSNRSTAENMMEMLFGATNRERQVWIGAFNEMFEKVLVMAGRGFNPKAVKASLSEMSSTRIAEIASMWLPLHDKGVISRQTLIERVPGVDAEIESERIAAEEAEITAQAIQAQKDAMGINRRISQHDESHDNSDASNSNNGKTQKGAVSK